GVAHENRYAHARRGDLDLGVEDLLGLDDHFPFFLGRSVVEELVDVRDDVEGNLLRKLLHVLFVADEDLARLVPQLVHAGFTGPRYGLVSRNDDALDRRGIMERLQRDDHLRGRAIGVRDNVARRVAVDRLGVYLGHDERNVGVHTVKRRVVDHDA